MVCFKVKYATEAAAIFDLQRIQKRSNRSKVPVRVYLCKCRAWHLTSKDDTLYEKIATLAAENQQLKTELIEITNKDNREARIITRADKRVKEQQNQIVALKEDIKKLRNDKSTLIAQLVKLQTLLDNVKNS